MLTILEELHKVRACGLDLGPLPTGWHWRPAASVVLGNIGLLNLRLTGMPVALD